MKTVIEKRRDDAYRRMKKREEVNGYISYRTNRGRNEVSLIKKK